MAGNPRPEPVGKALRSFIHFLDRTFGRIFRQGEIAWQFYKSAARHIALAPALGSADELAELSPGPVPEDAPSATPDSGAYKEQYGVIVICQDAGHQEHIFNQLTELGLTVKVVVT
jgi:hypothetical protein